MRTAIHVYSELSYALEGDLTCAYTAAGPFDRADAVGDACDYFWSNNDGWEWMRNGCTLYSVDADGVIFKHEVSAPDFVPTFWVPDGEEVTP